MSPNKTATVEPLTSNLTNHPSKMSKTCWRSMDEFMRDVLTLTHGHTRINQPTKTYIHPLSADTWCCLKDLPRLAAWKESVLSAQPDNEDDWELNPQFSSKGAETSSLAVTQQQSAQTHSTYCSNTDHKWYRGCPHGVMVKVMDCGIIVSEFVLQSRYYIHFRANTLGKDMNPPYPSSYGLNSTTTVLLGEWLWH